MEKMQEMFTKDLKELKSKQIEMNNTLEGITSRTEVEEQISDLEDRMVQINTAKQNTEKRMKRNEDSPRDLWDNIKCTNICTIGTPEEGKREKGTEKMFEEIAENMGKETVNQIQEAQKIPGRINPRRNTLRHTEIKLTKIKDRDKIKNKGKMTNNIQGKFHQAIS